MLQFEQTKASYRKYSTTNFEPEIIQTWVPPRFAPWLRKMLLKSAKTSADFWIVNALGHRVPGEDCVDDDENYCELLTASKVHKQCTWAIKAFREAVSKVGLEYVMLVSILASESAQVPWVALQPGLKKHIPSHEALVLLVTYLCRGDDFPSNETEFERYSKFIPNNWEYQISEWFQKHGITDELLCALMRAPSYDLRHHAAGFLCMYQALPHIPNLGKLIPLPAILEEENVEIRRMLIELYGMARFLKNSHALVVHEDRFGVLYKLNFDHDEPLVVVKVRNATAEPSGRFREYFLRVPPTMSTARDAVAWSFNMKPSDYDPIIES